MLDVYRPTVLDWEAMLDVHRPTVLDWAASVTIRSHFSTALTAKTCYLAGSLTA